MNDNPTIYPPADLVILEVHFDVDQLGSDLSHTLTRTKPGEQDPEPATGVHANSLYFAPGEQVALRVSGHGKATGVDAESSFVSFQIVDCVIATRPQIVQLGGGQRTRYAAPSPFQQAIGASYTLALDFSATASGLLPGGVRTVTQHWKRTLDVSMAPGLWELSLTLTIRIMRGPGAVNELRVFSFDPEAEVGGNGTMRL